jgi:hypothetical protein
MVRSILVALDGSPFGEHALPLSLAVARRAGARLQLAHVHVPVAPLYSGSELLYDLDMDTSLQEQERAYLDGVMRRLPPCPGVAVSAALLQGSVADAL